MLITLPKESCWLCPEGHFSATLVNAGPYADSSKYSSQHLIRLVFEVDVPLESNFQYMAARRYDTSRNKLSALRDDLTAWLGKEFLRDNHELDLNELQGRRADLNIVHIYNEGQPVPFVYIKDILPPGTLVREDNRIFAPNAQSITIHHVDHMNN